MACGCGFQASGPARTVQTLYQLHEHGPEPQQSGAESSTMIQTQDGRWLYHQEVPEIV